MSTERENYAEAAILGGCRPTRLEWAAMDLEDRAAFVRAGGLLIDALASSIAAKLAPLLAPPAPPPDPHAEELRRIHEALDAAHGQALASVGSA